MQNETGEPQPAQALCAARILSLPIQGEASNAGPNATQPVAESQAPAPSEPGDRGVAPTLADSRPARSRPCVVVPQGLFDDLHDFLDGQQDVIDGADGPRPNRAMSLLTELLAVEKSMLAAAKEE